MLHLPSQRIVIQSSLPSSIVFLCESHRRRLVQQTQEYHHQDSSKRRRRQQQEIPKIHYYCLGLIIMVMLRCTRVVHSWQNQYHQCQHGRVIRLNYRQCTYKTMTMENRGPRIDHPSLMGTQQRYRYYHYCWNAKRISSLSSEHRPSIVQLHLSSSSSSFSSIPPELSALEEDSNDDDDFVVVSHQQNDHPKISYLLKDLNPSQIEAVTQPIVVGVLQSSSSLLPDDHDRNDESQGAIITRVIAGPGSGKTKVLTTRIAYLLQQQEQLDGSGGRRRGGNVLAVTFTRKAAGEMKERLERLLRSLQELEQDDNETRGEDQDEDDDYAIRLDRHGNIIEETVNGEDGNEQPALPSGLERVELGTFHSICAKIMRYNGDLLEDLPSVHRDMSKAEPVYRTPKVDDDEEENSKKPPLLEKPELNLNGQFAIVDQSEQLRILKECLDEKNIDLKTLSVKPQQILSTICKMKEMFAQGQDPFVEDKKNKVGPTVRIARNVYYRYREKLLSNNAVDFDDLILMTRELLMENVELRLRLHRRWPHVLVDEFQDTSKSQIDLVKLFTSSTLFVVGDADQSIYSWRGAHVGSLQDVKRDFSSHGTVNTVYLKENYRSTSNIVRAAEKVISVQDNTGGNGESTQESVSDYVRRSMKPKRGPGRSPRVIACKDEESEADFVIDTILNMAATEEIGPNETIAVVYRTNAQSRHLEEACVAKNVPYIIRGGAGGFYKRAEIKDCLCFLRWLYNGNDEGSMLRAFKTPSKGIGEKAVEEFRKYCELVQTYYREYYPLSRRPTPLDVLISMTDDDALGESDSAMPSGAPQAADHISKRAFNNFLAFSLKMRDFRAHAYEMKVDELLFYIIEELNLMDHFNSISKSNSEFKERQENVQELRQAAKKYASSGTALNHRVPSSKDEAMGDQSALAIFLDDVALVSDVTESESQEMYGDRMVVNLMTIHASKGTEFDCVFVVGLEEGTLPCQPALQETENPVQLEEERRLCYVAMTRAKTHLILTWRREVTIFSDWSASGPKTVTKRRSRFLDALVSTKSKEDGAGREQKKTSDQRNVVSGSKRQISSSSNSGVGRHGLQGTNGSRKPNLVGERRYMDEAVKVQTGRKAWEQIRTNKKLSSSESNPLRKKKDVKRTPSSGPGTVSKKPSPDFDPTWFFPVGEVVLHRSLGKGVVLEHLPYSKIEEAEVSVQFENGKVCNFPALGSDIIPDLGTSRPR